MTKDNYIIIDDIQLQIMYEEIVQQEYIAIDIEFIRDSKRYYPKLCLMQIACKDSIYIIDFIEGVFDFNNIYKILFNNNIVKIFHDSKQDIEIIFNHFKKIPDLIFDTQIVSSLLNIDKSISYANLVYHYTGVTIDKKMQFTNWEKRPLKAEQLSYAINDVDFLYKIYPYLLDDIHKNNLNDRVSLALNRLYNINNYVNDPEYAWKKIKAIKYLDQDKKDIIKILAKKREIILQKHDIHRKSFISNSNLVKIVNNIPLSLSQINSYIDNIKYINKKYLEEYKLEINKIINNQ